MGVNRIDHAAILVNDVAQALEWYEGILGLKVLDSSRDRAHVTCKGEHADLTLVAGGHGPLAFAVGVDSLDDLEALEHKLDGHGVGHERITDPDRPGATQLTRFELITGHVIEFVVASDGRTAGETDFTWNGASHTPTDIDHINLLGAEAPAAVAEFLTDVVGFRVSGALEVEGEVGAVWTRTGSLDHDVAYMRAARPGDRLHHVAFAMVDGNHYQLLADRLADNGHMFEFGPGRHGAGLFNDIGFGSNLFAYAFDPSGNRNEFSGDMKVIPEDASTAVVDATGRVDEVMNAWAKNMPESFMTVGS
jgi:catechol 2,3-dioxygenase